MSRPGIQKCRMTFPRHPHHMRAAAQMMALAENTVTWFGLNGNKKRICKHSPRTASALRTRPARTPCAARGCMAAPPRRPSRSSRGTPRSSRPRPRLAPSARASGGAARGGASSSVARPGEQLGPERVRVSAQLPLIRTGTDKRVQPKTMGVVAFLCNSLRALSPCQRERSHC